VKNNKYLIVAGFILFVLLPYHLIIRLFFRDIYDAIIIWKEIILIIVPLGVLIIHGEIKWSKHTSILILLVLLLIIHILFIKINVRIAMIGLYNYIMMHWVSFIFKNIKKSDYILQLFIYPIIIVIFTGSIGMVFDSVFSWSYYFQYLDPDIDYTNFTSFNVYRPSFLFGSPVIAGQMLFIFSSMILLIHYSQNLVFKNLSHKNYLIIALFGYFGSFLAFSRGPWVATSIVLITILWIEKRKIISGRVILLIAGTILMVGVYFINLSSDERYFISFKFDSIINFENDSSNMKRQNSWKNGLIALEDNFLIGSGLGSGHPRSGSGINNHYESSYLLAINEGGIISLFAMSFIIFSPLFLIMKNKKQLSKDFRKIATSIIISLFLLWAVAPTFQNVIIAWLFSSICILIYLITTRSNICTQKSQ
jgi:O-antigen ligase